MKTNHLSKISNNDIISIVLAIQNYQKLRVREIVVDIVQ